MCQLLLNIFDLQDKQGFYWIETLRGLLKKRVKKPLTEEERKVLLKTNIQTIRGNYQTLLI
jgi:hypothetical protein